MTIKRMIQSWLLALALGPCALTSAHALRFNLFEIENTNGPEKAYIPIIDVLGVDARGAPYLKIDPDRDPNHRRFVDILVPGMPFDDVDQRNKVAEILAGFPKPCLPHLTLSVMVGPVEHIDSFVPGVKDKRRISAVDLGGCLAQDPKECFYDTLETGAVDFDIRMFRGVLKECLAATEAAIEHGPAYAEEVYADMPAYRGRSSTLPARAYFRGKATTKVAMAAELTNAEVLQYINSQPQWRGCYERFTFSPEQSQACAAGPSQNISCNGIHQWLREDCEARKNGIPGVWNCSVEAREIYRNDNGLLALQLHTRSYALPEKRANYDEAKQRYVHDTSECRRPESFAKERARIVEDARKEANAETRIRRDAADFAKAQQQIAEARHQANAAAASGDAEAAYFKGCLSYATTPDEIAGKLQLPKELDPEHPYACTRYDRDDHRGVYLNATGAGREAAEKAFEVAKRSNNPKIAARAYWNLALLQAQAYGPDSEQIAQVIANARRFDPAAFEPAQQK